MKHNFKNICRSLLFILALIIQVDVFASNVLERSKCGTCRYELGVNYDSSSNRLESEKSQDESQFSQYLYFRNHSKEPLAKAPFASKKPTWIYDLELSFSDKNITTGLEDQDGDEHRFGVGLFYALDSGNEYDVYDPENLPAWSAGFQFNFVKSDVFDENTNLDLVIQNRHLFPKGEMKFYGDSITKFGAIIEHDRDFSKGSTLYFDSHYRFGDVVGLTKFIGPRFVVEHFVTDEKELEDETTLSLQLVSEMKLNKFLGENFKKSTEIELRLRPILGYDRILNSLGRDSNLSSGYFLINLSLGLVPGKSEGTGRNGAGRYRRP